MNTAVRKSLASVAIAVLWAFTAQPAMSLEEPEYEVIAATDGYELRRYAPYIVAEVTVPGSQRKAGNSAFSILAGYIFGDNVAGEKMAMTAPVEATTPPRPEKMAMTAPVESSATVDGYIYSFVMEQKYTLETLPRPNDPRIAIRTNPERVMAVRRFSGSWREDNYDKNESGLLADLESDGIDVVGVPVFARYNSPFKPWFLRRNEVLVEVAAPRD